LTQVFLPCHSFIRNLRNPLRTLPFIQCLPPKRFGAASATSPLASITIKRRDVLPTDVQADILFCGVCHSDIHSVRNEWGGTMYPIVPGHEIVGRVTKVGASVTKFKVGDAIGVGCMVDSDGTCDACKDHQEMFCPNMKLTFNSKDSHLNTPTYGGYSDKIVVDQRFVVKIPDGLDLARAAPLLCAGITTYAPLRRYGITKGKKVGIVGLGGLGHVALKFAHAFGAHVVLLTSSPGKEEDAKKLGADLVCVTRNPDEMKKHANTLDFILDTVSAEHDMNNYLGLLKYNGTLCMVGLPEKPMSIRPMSIVFRQVSLSGSAIGGVKETQEMLDFSAKHGILADIELIPVQKINEAYERIIKSDVKYRFVIDIKSLNQ